MMDSASVVDVGRPAVARRSFVHSLRGGLKGGEYTWAVAFVVPYIAVFLAFVVYPVVYGVWMGSEVGLYRELFADPIYQDTVVNTALYLALGVNVKMFLALLLSGFFMRPGWWTKAMLMIFVLPWAVPQISTFISIHWMLNGEWGFLNNVLYKVFNIEGAYWLKLDGPGRRHRLPHLEVDTVLDADPAGRPDGHPARDPRHGQGGRCHRAARLRAHHLPTVGQPLPDLHAAVDDLPARRLQRRDLRHRRRPRQLYSRAGHAGHP
jgi:hypothetical protein